MKKIVLAVLLSASIAQSQTTKPATRPATRSVSAIPIAPMPLDKTDIAARAFLDRGLKELEAGHNEDAQRIFGDGLQVYGEKETSSVNDSETKTALNHAAAVANLRLNQLPQARTAIEKARAAKWTNDSLTFNLASVQLALKGQAQVAVTTLDKYMADHPDANESWVNVYGYALEHAATDTATRKKLEPQFKALDAFQAKLEKTRPGFHRWGNTWIDNKKYTEIQPKAQEAKQHLTQLQQAVDTAQAKVQQIQQQMQQQAANAGRSSGRSGRGGGRGRRGGGGGGGGGGSSANANGSPQAQLAQARTDLAKAQKDLASADRSGFPTWDMTIEGMIPQIAMEKE